MILGFKTKFPWGETTMFQQKIIQSATEPTKIVFPGHGLLVPKIHTIRESLRMKPGIVMQMATGVRTKNYYQFNKDIPELSLCKSTQGINIYSPIGDMEGTVFVARGGGTVKEPKHYDFRKLEKEQLQVFALNDGFTSVDQFWKYFNKDFTGQIIHWTDLRY